MAGDKAGSEHPARPTREGRSTDWNEGSQAVEQRGREHRWGK